MRRLLLFLLAACEHTEARPVEAPNLAAYIPVQCYAPLQRHGRANASCAVCHRGSREPNYVDDKNLQTEQSFPRYALVNRWTNALHSPQPVVIPDDALLAYVRTNNYRGWPASAELPACAFSPDADGWDRDAHGELTGWRAYSYTPTPGLFWPTNGSFGDAYIRLPPAFRRDSEGNTSQVVYAHNLAVVEAMIQHAATDAHYVGEAAAVRPVPGLFPSGTEIVHSLRYLDVVDGHVQPARRMKELRYMRKRRAMTYAELDIAAKHDAREAEQEPDALRAVYGDATTGLATGTGWTMQALIERGDGTLRPQSHEETSACIGCHGGVGATTDSTFSFARMTGWGAENVFGMPEPENGEYSAYLANVGRDDFAANDEVVVFDPQDISTLIVPSPTRALALDRSYLAIVRDQSFVRGRDVILGKRAEILATVGPDSTSSSDSARADARARSRLLAHPP